VVPVDGHDGYVIAAGFGGTLFLSPALTHDGVMSALMPPGEEFIVVRGGATAPDSLPEPTGVVELAPGDSQFRYTADIDVLGATWTLGVFSGQNFLEIPRSSEPLAILLGGLSLALAVFGLLLVRQLAAQRESLVSAELVRSNRRYLTGFDRAPIGMAEVDAVGVVLRSNRTMAAQLGRPLGRIKGHALSEFVHPDDAGEQSARMTQLADGSSAGTHAELRYLRPDGQVVWIAESVSALDRADDVDRRFLIQAFDTTDRQDAELKLHDLAFNDSLTGLPNRTRLFEYLETQLVASRDTDEPVALLFIDIDRFKIVNDSLGHSAGDDVLRTIANRLLSLVPSPHLVARFGGDEFAVVCSGVGDGAALDGFARNIHIEMRKPIDLDGEPIQVTASIGVIVGYGATDTPESLLRDADAAMYKAKAAGRNTTERFEAAIRSAAVHRLDLERSLRRAIERDEFIIHYQPVVDLGTNTVAGFEALLRWEHPDRGLLDASEFLGVADEAGLLDEIDAVTLQRAWNQLGKWSDQSDAAKDWHLAVNCSSRWFHDSRLRDILPGVLSSNSLDADRLWLEVTEHHLLSDAESAVTALADLHDLGVNVAIDDFGTGFSSLSYLSRFNVDRLKIDRSFIQSLDNSDADEAIITAVVDLASALGIPTVAEGTESLAQLDALRRLGANFAQGFALSRPLSTLQVDQALARMN
jgi:diguanylate cyclase (GGDEF)-like protein/PAS domain S-box-containing protein